MNGNAGTPLGSRVVVTLTSITPTTTLSNIVDGVGVDYAVVQCIKLDSYPDDRKICNYRLDGDAAEQSSDFYLGHGDFIIFRKGELKKGVNFISAENSSQLYCRLIIQYYQN